MVRREDYDWWEANVRYEAERAEREDEVETGTFLGWPITKGETREIDVTTVDGGPKTISFPVDNHAYRRDFRMVRREDPADAHHSRALADEDEIDRWANEGGAI